MEDVIDPGSEEHDDHDDDLSRYAKKHLMKKTHQNQTHSLPSLIALY